MAKIYSKEDRTLEVYMQAGAEMRLLKSIGTRLAVDMGKILPVAELDKLKKALAKIDEVCSKADGNMFRDHKEIPDMFACVFNGHIGLKPRNEVDKRVLSIAKDVVGEMLGEGKG